MAQAFVMVMAAAETNGLIAFSSLFVSISVFFYQLGCNNTSVISLDLIGRVCERCIKKQKKKKKSGSRVKE